MLLVVDYVHSQDTRAEELWAGGVSLSVISMLSELKADGNKLKSLSGVLKDRIQRTPVLMCNQVKICPNYLM